VDLRRIDVKKVGVSLFGRAVNELRFEWAESLTWWGMEPGTKTLPNAGRTMLRIMV
jgi:hypothetical protein